MIWAGAIAPTAARAASPLTWSPSVGFDPGQSPSAIACPGEGLCVAVDRTGHALNTRNPAAVSPSWSKPVPIDSGHVLTAVACASEALCVAVDEEGEQLASTNPSGGASSWHSTPIDTSALTGVACPSSTLCVAVDQAGNTLVSRDPGAAAPSWQKANIDGAVALKSVSCASEALCVAVDGSGNALASEDPASPGAAWRTRAIDPLGEPRVVSCSPRLPCMVTDSTGNALASANPAAAAPTWNATEVDPGAVPGALSCATSGLCVLVDDHGQALASDDATAAIPTWSASSADPGAAVTGISCLGSGLCVAIDSVGRFVTGLVGSPLASTTAAAEVTSSEATLTATVDPRDGMLSRCRFEYGLTAAYGQSAECATTPSPTAGPQALSARVTGLLSEAAYHFRIVAANGGGTATGTDLTFTTPAPLSVVHPRPSIAGVPGVGERMRCNSGVPSDAIAAVTYAWVRDSATIAGAGSSSYVIANADAKHHLQCRVTATNAAGSATAGSTFVAVPAAGVLAATGESKVGKLRVSATTISVPLTCAKQAPAGCTIAARATATQVRAGKPPRRVTVTVAAASTRLKQGRTGTIVLKLNTTGRRLLARGHRLAVRVAITGTVIGTLRASLASATVTLRSSSGHAARRTRSASRHARSGAGHAR